MTLSSSKFCILSNKRENCVQFLTRNILIAGSWLHTFPRGALEACRRNNSW